MKLFKKKYYFVLRKGGTSKYGFDMYMYLSQKKFKIAGSLHSSMLLTWYQAQYYWILFNLPKWLKRNGSLFNYYKVRGVIHKRKISDEVSHALQNADSRTSMRNMYQQAIHDSKSNQ